MSILLDFDIDIEDDLFYTEDEKLKIKTIARKKGMTVSEFILYSLMRTISEYEIYELIKK